MYLVHHCINQRTFKKSTIKIHVLWIFAILYRNLDKFCYWSKKVFF